MSADQILRTGRGNVVAVFRAGRFRNRGSCSCGWDGPLRMLLGWAVIDAWQHAGRSPGCLPSDRLIVDERGHHRLIRRVPVALLAAMPILLVPADLLRQWLA